jgi:hypothetical protein
MLKPMTRGREAAFADEEEELRDQPGAGSEKEMGGEYFREMLRRIKLAEDEAATALQEARQTELEWDAMMPAAQPELVYARPVQSQKVSAMKMLQSRLAKQLGKLALGLNLLAAAQIYVVAASEGELSKDLGAEVNPEDKALLEDVERVARRLVTIEERYAPSVVNVTRRIVRDDMGDSPEVAPQASASGPERLPDASAEQYEQFSQEADQLLQRTIAEGNVPLGEDAWSWEEDVLDPLARQFEARHGVAISVHEGPVDTNFQQMLRNYIRETVDANPDQASQVADALEPGDGYRLAVHRHDGKVAAERLYDYLMEGDTLVDVVSEGPEHLRWILPHVNPTDQAEMLELLRNSESDVSHLAREAQSPDLQQKASRLRAAIQLIESTRR